MEKVRDFIPLNFPEPFAAVKKIHVIYKEIENYVAYKIDRLEHDVIIKDYK